MKPKPGFALAVAGLCLLFEGVDAKSVPDLIDARRAVIEYYMPKDAYRFFDDLSRQADSTGQIVRWSVNNESSDDFWFNELSSAEQKLIEKLFAMENRTTTFLNGSFLVHPRREIEIKMQKGRAGGSLYLLGGRKS